MDAATIDFYRNGRSLGRAFEKISTGAGFAYFPTVSLALGETITANFGSTPMHYPIEGYKPLQEPPKEEIAEATLLFQWLLKIVKLINMQQNMDEQSMLHDENISIRVFLMCLSRPVLKYIGFLITIPYITEHIVVPFMQQLSEFKVDATNESMPLTVHPSMLFTCLDLLWTFLEKHEIKVFLESTVLCLLSAFRHLSLLLEYPDQCKSLLLLTKICQHPSIRQYLLLYVLFDRVRFADFMYVTPLDEGGLADVVNKVWWEMNPVDPAIEANKASYLDACEKIKTAMSGMISFKVFLQFISPCFYYYGNHFVEVEKVQVELILTLLNNSDANDKKPTSRTIFLTKFKRFVQENYKSSRVSTETIKFIILEPFYNSFVARSLGLAIRNC